MHLQPAFRRIVPLRQVFKIGQSTPRCHLHVDQHFLTLKGQGQTSRENVSFPKVRIMMYSIAVYSMYSTWGILYVKMSSLGKPQREELFHKTFYVKIMFENT